MSILKYFDIHHSLITRVVFWAVLTALVVFQTIFGFAIYFAEQDMTKQADEKVNIGLDIALNAIDDELEGVEDGAHNAVDFLKTKFPRNDRDVNIFLETLTLSNTFMQGVVMAFERGALPQHPNGYAPYVTKHDDAYEVRELHVTQPEYWKNSWYADAAKLQKGQWNKVFKDVNGMTITSYSTPFYDSEGKFQGVLAFDVNLSDVEKQVGQVKPFPNSSYFVLDSDLEFLVAPGDSTLRGRSLEESITSFEIHPNESILVDIKNRVRGFDIYMRNDVETRVYYAPTQYAGMTIGVELPTSDITSPVRRIRKMMFILSVTGILLLSIAIIIVLRQQMNSVKHFIKAARSIASGNFNTPIPQASDPNELYRLGVALDEMQTSLRTYMDDLTTTQQAKGKMENELHIASGIQKAMLPKIYPPYPDRDDLDIYGQLIPAREVGGDLYDFFIRDEKLFFCIGDVSGKGVPASLVMAVTRSLIRIVALRESSPKRIMSTINNSMADMNESSMFVTMFIGVLDLPTGKLRYCNGGHNAPLLLSDGGAKVEMFDVKANLPVGIVEEMDFEGQEMDLMAGDSIFLYTDGLTEAENETHELFGDKAMIDTLKNESKNNARKMIDDVVNKVRQHAGNAEQSDDLTMLAIRYMGQQAEVKFVKKLTLTNNLQEIARLTTYVEEVGEALRFDMGTVMNLNLALEEAVVNIIDYAYPEGTNGNIDIVTSATDEYMKMVITDHGQPFDPTVKKDPDITLGVDERQIGGLGIFLIRNIMDSVNYEYIDKANVLTLRKYFNSKE